MCEGCLMRSLPPEERKKYEEMLHKRYYISREDLERIETLFRKNSQMPVIEVNYGKKTGGTTTIVEDKWRF